jgi:hypothetical protein
MVLACILSLLRQGLGAFSCRDTFWPLLFRGGRSHSASFLPQHVSVVLYRGTTLGYSLPRHRLGRCSAVASGSPLCSAVTRFSAVFSAATQLRAVPYRAAILPLRVYAATHF